MNNLTQCNTGTTGCCPGDKELRRAWLQALEKEHESIKLTSEKIATRFKLLSHPDRVKIMLMLEQREHCMDEIVRKLGTRKSAVSYHLGLLKKHGMISVKRRSRFAFYGLSVKGRGMLEEDSSKFFESVC